MVQKGTAPTTSAGIAAWVDANPVVVRRIFGGLRDAGIVSSEKGHGGGWRLARDPASITLAQVLAALNETLVKLPEAEESHGCFVEQAVNRSLALTVAETNRILHARLSGITLTMLLDDVEELAASGRHDGPRESLLTRS